LLVGECVPKKDLLCLNYCKWDDAPRVEQLFSVVIERAIVSADRVERVVIIGRGRDPDLQARISAEVIVQPKYLGWVSAWWVGWLLREVAYQVC